MLDVVLEVDGAFAELSGDFQHLGLLLVEGLVVGDVLLGSEVLSALVLFVVPICYAVHLHGATVVLGCYVKEVGDACAVEYKELFAECYVLFRFYSKCAGGLREY